MNARVKYSFLSSQSESILCGWVIFLLPIYELGNIRQRPPPGRSMVEYEEDLLTSTHSLSAQDQRCRGILLGYWDIIGSMVTTALVVIIALFQYILGNYHLGKKKTKTKKTKKTSFIYSCTKKLVKKVIKPK